uniref:Synaptogyrin n=1 Tax=Cyprinus carpio TaxID=7962 RepID=A0A8C1S676_CYPCA
METSAYGASLAGGAFDFWSFLKRPQTIARLFSWLFAIVVFATIVSEGYMNEKHEETPKCMFNQNDSACSYGVGVGILAFLACVVFIVLDAYFPQISNANERKYIVLGDLCFSGVWTFLWFVCFCVLANQWSHTTQTGVLADAARAVVTFSFFSTATWAILTTFAFQRYRQGVDEVGLGYNDPSSSDHTSPYPSAYAGAPEGYQQSPFTASAAAQGGYQPPAY